METFNKILILFLLLAGKLSFSQSDTLNRTDEDGKRQGYWIVYGRDFPEKGYPPDGKIEEGTYVDDYKNGRWIKYHKDGKTPRLIGEYVKGRPSGNYSKIYPNGLVMESGTYVGGKQIGEKKRYFENGCLAFVKYFNENGKEDGIQFYYFPNCEKSISEVGQFDYIFKIEDGVYVDTSFRYYPNGELKEVRVYGDDGETKSLEHFVATKPYDTTLVNDGCGRIRPGICGPSTKFNPNGYNKIYNDHDELWMDGEFKNGRLMNGKLYKYDSDGVLLKIEVWKEGKYCSECHKSENVQQDTLNRTDENGLKQGYWIVYGGDRPESGYPSMGKIEEGNYLDGRKNGWWTKYYKDGATPRMEAVYQNSRPTGPYKRYYESGCLKEEYYGENNNVRTGGSWSRGINYSNPNTKFYLDDCNYPDSFKGTSDSTLPYHSSTTINDGIDTIRYYYPNGQLEFELIKIDGIPIDTARRYFEDGSLKQLIIYNDAGLVNKTIDFDPPHDLYDDLGEGEGGPEFKGGKRKDGKPIDPNGYNKIYNNEDELWMDGFFKNGRLWDGKHYLYDEDGILTKIEIWKKGKYHGDAQLK